MGKKKLFLSSCAFFLLVMLIVQGTWSTAGGRIDTGNMNGQKHKGTDEMLQFTAGGHVLRFQKGEMFVASADHALRVEFMNARPVSPKEEVISQDSENSRQAAKPLGKVTYRYLWDGVTLAYEKHSSGVVKSTYYIQPVGDSTVNPADQICLRYNIQVKVDESGSLLFTFETGQMKESRPVAWQEIRGKRIPVEASFHALGEKEVSIRAGPYDPRFPLVIDPVLVWNTFMGSASYDAGNGIAVDTSGNVYVAGLSAAAWGTPVNDNAGGYEAFAAKLGEPEVTIKYDDTDVPDGGSYNFDLHNAGTDTDVTFTIENLGNADLTLTTPIAIGAEMLQGRLSL